MTSPPGQWVAERPGARHPRDPDPVPATKALAVLALGTVGLVTGPLLGGLIPATVALLLARQCGRELQAAEGFLLGGRRVRVGVRLAWAGIVLAGATVVVAAVAGLLTLADPGGGHDYAPTVN